jgi:hypothetical protein
MVNFENFIAKGPTIIWQSYEGDPQAYSRRLILTSGGKIVGEHCEGNSRLGEPRWSELDNKLVNQIIVCELSPQLISYVQDVEGSKKAPKKAVRKKAVKKKTKKKATRRAAARKAVKDVELWNGEGLVPPFPE